MKLAMPEAGSHQSQAALCRCVQHRVQQVPAVVLIMLLLDNPVPNAEDGARS